MLKVIGIGGSLREGSATTLAMQNALDGALSYGAEVNCVELVHMQLPFFNGTYDLDLYNPSEKTAILSFFEQVETAQGVILASPTYHNTVSGILKNALEILEIGHENLPSRLANKAVGLVTVQGGTSGTGNNTITTMLLAARSMGAWVVPTMVSIPGSRTAFTPDGIPSNPSIQRRLHHLGHEVAQAGEMLTNHWKVV